MRETSTTACSHPEDFISPSALSRIHVCGAHIPDVLTAGVCRPLVVLRCHGGPQHLPLHTFLHLHIQHHHLLQPGALLITCKESLLMALGTLGGHGATTSAVVSAGDRAAMSHHNEHDTSSRGKVGAKRHVLKVMQMDPLTMLRLKVCVYTYAGRVAVTK